MLNDQTVKGNPNYKPEVPTSQLVDKIGMTCQQLDQQFNMTSGHDVRPNRK